MNNIDYYLFIIIPFFSILFHELGHFVFAFIFNNRNTVKLNPTFTIQNFTICFNYNSDNKLHIIITSLGGLVFNLIAILIVSYFNFKYSEYVIMCNIFLILNIFTPYSEDLNTIIKICQREDL